MEAVTETLFEAFAEGEILTEDNTYDKMTEAFAEYEENAKTGNFDADKLSCLQYAAMRAVFYAGVKAVRSLMR